MKALALLLTPLLASAAVLHRATSQFGPVVVEERDGLRYLQLGDPPTTQTVVKPGAPSHLEVEYTRSSMAGLLFPRQVKRALVIGVGGGAMPMFLRWLDRGMVIDGVDIDPTVVAVAKRWFDLREDAKLKAHIMDGRRFVERAKGGYDVIFLDAYAPDYIPPHLATRQFFARVREKLAPGGVFVTNVWGPPNKNYHPIVAGQRAVFDELYVVRGVHDENHILLALPRKERLTREALATRARRWQTEHKVPFDLADAIRDGFDDLTARPLQAPALEDPAP